MVQRIMRVDLLTFSGLIGQDDLSKVFFQTTVTCNDGFIAQGGEFHDSQSMPDTSLHGAILRD